MLIEPFSSAYLASLSSAIMSTILDYALAETSRSRQQLLALAKARVQAPSGNAIAAGFAGVGGPLSILNQGRSLGTHTEQYKHFTGWPFAAIKIIGQRIAERPLHVARLSRSPASGRTRQFNCPGKNTLPLGLKSHAENLDLLETHPLLDAFDDPNELMVRWVLLFNLAANLCLTGKAHLWIRESDDRPGKLDIWPLPSNWIEPVHTPRLLDHWLLHFGGVPQNGIRIPREQVAYLYYPRPDNPLEAVSPLSCIARAVVVD